jgi:hypothetical protein
MKGTRHRSQGARPGLGEKKIGVREVWGNKGRGVLVLFVSLKRTRLPL